MPKNRTLLFPDIESKVSALRAGRIDVAIPSSPTAIGLLVGDKAEGPERATPFVTTDKQVNEGLVSSMTNGLQHFISHALFEPDTTDTDAVVQPLAADATPPFGIRHSASEGARPSDRPQAASGEGDGHRE